MAKWTKDMVTGKLEEAGLEWEESEIENGHRFTLPEGTPINLYNTGTLLVQGKKCNERTQAETLFASAAPKPVPAHATSKGKGTTATAVPAIDSRKKREVFVVYGHDLEARNELELLLRRLDIKPLILGNLAINGKTIIEALIEYSDSPFAIVLLTPDDEGHRAGKSGEKRFRARQNVVLELGMFLEKVGREGVAILHKGDMELPSDIHGLIYIPFKNHVAELKTKLASVLQKAGYEISIEALSAE